MSEVTLTDAFFARIAGWEAMKQARAVVRDQRVLSADWSPPVLKGVVQSGGSTLRCGFLIRSERDIENLCPCRTSRSTGAMCAHSVAVGLWWSHRPSEEALPASASPAPSSSKKPDPIQTPVSPRPLLRRAAPGAGGQPVRLFVVIPPNLEQAAAQGRMSLYLEAQWKGQKKPLSALPDSEPLLFSEQDQTLLEWAETFAQDGWPAMLRLGETDWADVCALLVGHPRVTLGKAKAIEISATPWSPPVRAELESGGEILLQLSRPQAPPLVLPGAWVWTGETLQPFGLPARILGLFEGPVRIPRQEVPQFLLQEWPALSLAPATTANFELSQFTLDQATPDIRLHLRGGLAMLEADLSFHYARQTADPEEAPAPSQGDWLPDPDSPTRYHGRHTALEQAAIARLVRGGFEKTKQKGRWKLTGRETVLNFFARDYPHLTKSWRVSLEERLEKSTERNLEWIEPKFEVRSSGTDWFHLDLNYQSARGQTMSPAEIQRLLRSGHSHAPVRGGKIALLDTGAVEDLQEVIAECSARQDARGFRIPTPQAGFLESTVREQGWSVHAASDWLEKARGARPGARFECPDLGHLNAVLRPYQKAGVAWMQFLREQHFGGILADEMGLGKTLQALAHLHALHQNMNPPGQPHLVVCPTSLLPNWAAESRRFTPDLKTIIWHGPSRRRLTPEQLAQHHVILTSYALVKNDQELFRAIHFDTVILDEAQHIKNRQTQNARVVKGLSADHRLVLTGTPLENSVQDLWSIFDFLMPAYLGTAREFKERYEIPLAHQPGGVTQNRLARRIRPFLLRRTKKEVAPELPAKLEQVAYCELNDDQRTLYRQVLEAGRQEIFGAGTRKGQGANRLLILNTLLRLRQICCDPRLIHPQDAPVPPPSTPPSAKLELFAELLEEALDGGHRLLVFSQFVRMLDLIRNDLEQRQIQYCYLHGATRDRSGVVQRFQKNPSIPVFLISLKAGGVGLNLTGADTVVHFDPWWNPMTEAQATDRAHRIGQTRVVTSYKLIARGTIEEKILQLQQRKRETIQSTLGDEDSLAKALSWEEIQELLA